MLLPRALARFNRRVTNRVLGPLASVTPPFAVVKHRGRHSGNIYRTVVWVWRTDSGYLIALTYGTETEWVRNVLTAGGCRIEQRGRSVPVKNPRLVGIDAALPRVTPAMRPVLRAVKVRDWLSLDRSDDPSAHVEGDDPA